MTPHQQTISSPINGNCLQACVASLLDLQMEEVPNFMDIEDPEDDAAWFKSLCDFVWEKGYWLKDVWSVWSDIRSCIEKNPGIDGYFIGGVKSLNFEGCTHAVIFKGLECIHDPSPKNKFTGSGTEASHYYVIERRDR